MRSGGATAAGATTGWVWHRHASSTALRHVSTAQHSALTQPVRVPPTPAGCAGTAFVEGHDIRREMPAIYSLMGVCPQVWRWGGSCWGHVAAVAEGAVATAVQAPVSIRPALKPSPKSCRPNPATTHTLPCPHPPPPLPPGQPAVGAAERAGAPHVLRPPQGAAPAGTVRLCCRVLCVRSASRHTRVSGCTLLPGQRRIAANSIIPPARPHA